MSLGMNPYGNGNGTSGISGYYIDPDDNFIEIEYANGGVYTYQKRNVGELNFLKMKVLAMEGEGLNAFINKHVRNRNVNRPTTPVNEPVILRIITSAKEAGEIMAAIAPKFDVKITVS